MVAVADVADVAVAVTPDRAHEAEADLEALADAMATETRTARRERTAATRDPARARQPDPDHALVSDPPRHVPTTRPARARLSRRPPIARRCALNRALDRRSNAAPTRVLVRQSTTRARPRLTADATTPMARADADRSHALDRARLCAKLFTMIVEPRLRRM